MARAAARAATPRSPGGVANREAREGPTLLVMVLAALGGGLVGGLLGALAVWAMDEIEWRRRRERFRRMRW